MLMCNLIAPDTADLSVRLAGRTTAIRQFSPFHATGLFLCPLEISEGLWYSVVFMGCGEGSVSWGGLMIALRGGCTNRS